MANRVTLFGVFSVTWVAGTGNIIVTYPKKGPEKCDLSKKGGFSAIFWLRTEFLCVDTVFHVCTLTNFMILCIYGRYTDQLERERPGHIMVRDSSGLGCPSCVGQVWGFEISGEPTDESWGALVGPNFQLLGSRP